MKFFCVLIFFGFVCESILILFDLIMVLKFYLFYFKFLVVEFEFVSVCIFFFSGK